MQTNPTTRFNACIPFILKHEGGYVDHKKDPGGRTNRGITQRTYERYLGRKVTLEEMVDLSEATAKDIYLKDYWRYADDLPPGLDLYVFDMAVNMGPGRATRFLRECRLKLENRDVPYSDLDLLEELRARRTAFYKSLPHFPTFGRGWLRRTEDAYKTAAKMVADAEASKDKTASGL